MRLAMVAITDAGAIGPQDQYDGASGRQKSSLDKLTVIQSAREFRGARR